MNDKVYIEACASAERNRQKLINALPVGLVRREDDLAARISRVSGGVYKKLNVLYDFMDEMYEIVNRYTPCNKGCFHCCYYDISVNKLEVEYIRRSVRKSVITAAIRRRNKTHACPFLDKNACSIYQYRPYVCRRHVVFMETSDWCVEKFSLEREFPLLRFTGIENSFKNILAERGLHEVCDIRDAF